MNNTTEYKEIDAYLANGLGLHMILVWGRVALVQGIPVVFENNSVLIIVCTFSLALYYFYVLFIKYKRIPIINEGSKYVAIFVFISWLATIMIWPENIQYMDPIGNTLVYEIWPFIVLSMITNIDLLYDSMVRASKFLMVLCAISSIGIIIAGHTTVSTWSMYNMPIGYATLYAVMWLLSDFSKERKVFTSILLLIGVLILVLFGARNPLLSVMAFIIVEIFKTRKIGAPGKLLLLFSLVILLLCWKPILTGIDNLSQRFGISSRTLKLFLNEDFLADGRSGIHQRLFQLLINHPFGVGIAGDVAQTHEFAHGLYISILCTYGYIIGGVVIITIISILVKAYNKSYGIKRDILSIYMLTVLPRGFTGGDVWSSDVFWWMIGVSMSIIYGKIEQKNNLQGES